MSENKSPKQNQVRRVVIDHRFATDLFSERNRIVNGLPKDAEFVRAYPMDSRQTFELVFRSATFSPVEEGKEIPEYDIAIEEIPEYHTTPEHKR